MARPLSIFAPVTRPTSTPASFTASPLNTPEASENTAFSGYWCEKSWRFPILMASPMVKTADRAENERTLTSVPLENRRALMGPSLRRGG